MADKLVAWPQIDQDTDRANSYNSASISPSISIAELIGQHSNLSLQEDEDENGSFTLTGTFPDTAGNIPIAVDGYPHPIFSQDFVGPRPPRRKPKPIF